VSAPASTVPRLAVSGVSKSFGGIRALTDVSFAVAPGSIHALLGENGAGKSTLVKIVTGIQPADTGEIRLDGTTVRFRSPLEARTAGVVAVYQDPKLFPHLDVAENIFMGAHPTGAFGMITRQAMIERAQRLLDALDSGLDARQSVLGLSIGEAQFIEFARATAAGRMRLLFLDEPTAALTPAETERLFRLVRRLRGEGTSVVFISHRLEELEGLVDEVTILRDGRHVTTRQAAGLSEEEIVRSMVGRPVEQVYGRETGATWGAERLIVRDLSAPGEFEDVSFSLRAGEVVGMAGLIGAGRSEIAQGIMGLIPTSAGSVLVDGREVGRRSPRAMQDLGVAYLPEDRDGVGLVTSHSVLANMSLAILSRLSRLGAILLDRERRSMGELARRLQVKAVSLDAPVSSLSGGNRQKVVLGKWLALEPRVLILDEPTHGIDVGTKAQVHAIIADLARQGIAILLISSDLPEVLGVSDRILVVRQGRIVASIARAEATQERVMAAAAGERRAA
jgi:rhamnose transport system ATP-binding protein